MTASAPPHGAPRRRRPRRHLAVLAVPYLWSVVAIAGVARIRVSPAGIPFLLWWMLAGVIVTVACLAVAWRGDERRRIQRGHGTVAKEGR